MTKDLDPLELLKTVKPYGKSVPKNQPVLDREALFKGITMNEIQQTPRRSTSRWVSPSKMIPAACAAFLLVAGGVFAFNSINAPSASAMDEIEEAIENTEEFTSGKVTIEMEFASESEESNVVVSAAKQGADSTFVYEEDTQYFEPTEDDPEIALQSSLNLVRVGDYIYGESTSQDGKWIKVDAAGFDYADDTFFLPFQNNGEKLDLSRVVALMEQSDNLQKEDTSGSEKKYSAQIDLKKITPEEAALLPSGLDVMAAEEYGVNADDTLTGMADMSVYANDGVLEKIIVSLVSDSDEKLVVTTTYSELGENQVVEAPSEELILTPKEAYEDISDCSGICLPFDLMDSGFSLSGDEK